MYTVINTKRLIILTSKEKEMDTFEEMLVRKRLELKEYLCFAGLFLGVPILAIVLFSVLSSIPLLSILALPVVVVLGFFAIRFNKNLLQEYEYSALNGELTVDVIYGQRKRKRLISLDVRKIEALEPYSEEKYGRSKLDTKIFAGRSHKPEELWVAEFRTEKEGHGLLLFSPDDKFLRGLKTFLPMLISREIFKK
ncbi:MAG: hypothetical protein LBS74_11230 [Oscillospiraceae bacterium]|jgi:hypothetical protein|nr:hypothetical protein [Oscillospiraceae bacterium]